VPSDQILAAFNSLLLPILKKANNNENIVLAELRDTLLPKLMSGEIRVKDVEREVEAAV
jgi:type I restriction enzyme S subunit